MTPSISAGGYVITHDRSQMHAASKQLSSTASSLGREALQGLIPGSDIFGVFISTLASRLISTVLGSNASIITGLSSAIHATGELLDLTADMYETQEIDSAMLLRQISQAVGK